MKLRKKLIMSAVALAACAATLTSTTYAWYVSNQEATVTGMTGLTQATTGESVYVSSDGVNFLGDITLTSEQYTVNGELQPITYQTVDSAQKFLQLDGTTEVTDATSAYIKFSVWVKSDKAVTITPKFTVTNVTGITETQTTAVLPTQTAYQAISASVGASKTFTVDAVQAMYAKIDQVEGVASTETGNVGGYTYAEGTSTVYPLQQLSEVATVTGTTTTWNNYTPISGSLLDTDIATASTADNIRDAHEYYKDIVGEDPTYKTVYSTLVNDWSTFELSADKPTKLTFTIWLDGADTLCFDACAGQNFKFALSFTASKTPVVEDGE